ncbi:glycosyltransferase family 2 protein [Cylindrospermopsis raciborskii]|uniref:glycosyltransferase family 2 protein n=1 Tax=Cylindrospermopsis raciborskii TaxID=77022 RepID=UPI0008DE905E|nr:glycosyltransferase family 2 protein [Cylindrospermopsis raciborskii]NLQ06429.1 glycosyltransferase [Cylindrospermopsis raciborskii MVCC19]OHY33512.1 hypothetical protein BCV64_09165 [Cylindrospermopsis raciborskii MVCC14]
MEPVKSFCLDEKYSTTRLVTKQPPTPREIYDNKSGRVLFLPWVEGRKGEGGLRTRGLFKISLPAKPLVTIVTVVFNGGTHLERTLLSVINQSYENIEYIIIDGGSNDSTLDIIERYEHAIDYWVSEPDSGIYNAMNKGVYCSGGDYTLHLNSDDYFSDNVIIKVIEQIQKSPGFDVYHGSMMIHQGSKPLTTRFGHGFLPTSIPAYQPAAFVRLQSLGNLKWFDTKYKIAADFKFFKELQIQKLKFLRIDLLITHFSTGGASSDNRTRMLELKEILSELKYPSFIINLLLLRIRLVEYLKALLPSLH